MQQDVDLIWTIKYHFKIIAFFLNGVIYSFVIFQRGPGAKHQFSVYGILDELSTKYPKFVLFAQCFCRLPRRRIRGHAVHYTHKEDISKAIKFANKCASQVCRKKGTSIVVKD